MLPPHALRFEGNKVAAIGHSVQIKRPTNDGEKCTHDGITLHHPCQLFFGLVQLFLCIPWVRVIFTNVVMVLVVLTMRQLCVGVGVGGGDSEET